MTRKQLQELLNQLSEDLRTEVNVSRADLKQARSIVTKLENLSRKADGLIAKLDDAETGVNAKLDASNTSARSVEAFVATAADNLKVIDTLLHDTEHNVASMESLLGNFETTKAKLDNPETGLEATLTTAQQYKAQAQTAAAQAANLAAKIQSNLDAVQHDLTTAQGIFDQFRTIRIEIDDEETGLEATVKNAQSLKNEIAAVNKEGQTLYAEISRYKDQAAKNVSSIQTIRSESDIALEAIRQNESESEETKTRISKIFELVSQSGHANYFDERRRHLVYAGWGWLLGAVLALLFAVYLAIQYLVPLFPVQETSKIVMKPQDIEIGAIILRAFIVTPFVAFAVYCLGQYGKERKLAEQYAFKAVSASTIEGSITLIERSLKSVPSEHLNTQLADFAIKTAHSLHTEPQELQKLSRFSFNFGSKLAGIGAEINDTLGSINKELQEAASKKTVDPNLEKTP